VFVGAVPTKLHQTAVETILGTCKIRHAMLAIRRVVDSLLGQESLAGRYHESKNRLISLKQSRRRAMPRRRIRFWLTPWCGTCSSDIRTFAAFPHQGSSLRAADSSRTSAIAQRAATLEIP